MSLGCIHHPHIISSCHLRTQNSKPHFQVCVAELCASENKEGLKKTLSTTIYFSISSKVGVSFNSSDE
jgi:hypothetical protein